MVTDCKKNPYQWTYIFPWWIGGNLSKWQVWFDFGTKEE